MYGILWEFRVREGAEQRFVEGYGPKGDWARLFQRSAGYRRTELARSTSDSRLFFTFDYWNSQEEFERFRREHAAAYEELDKKFEGLTETERRIGAFEKE